MANTYLSRTPSSASNLKTWTWSGWVKRGSISTGNQVLFEARDSSGFFEKIQFISNDKLEYDHDIAGTDYTINSERVFRDTNGWYHIVVARDTTQSTEANRIKIYVNGEQVTQTEVGLGYPPQNYDSFINNTNVHYIGANHGSEYFDGCMSHIHFVDGSALAPTVFGETDTTTGEWKIKTDPSFTPGTNGFTVLKDGNTITDQSTNSNNFALAGGTLTKTEDNPSNVFATMNTLNKENGGSTLSLGNTKLVTTAQGGGPYTGRTVATLGASSGKYYWEVKPTTDVANTYPVCAIVGEDFNVHDSSGYLSGNNSNSKSYITFKMSSGGIAINFTGSRVTASYGNAVSANDIVGVALDLDNGKIFFSINGTWQNSGDPANGTNPASNSVGSLGGDIVFPAFGDENYSTSATMYVNFGNGYFGTTAVSSAGTNASGIGIFEYDVPTGYTALSTKGLNE